MARFCPPISASKAAPPSLFDHVAIIASDDGAQRLAGMGAAQDFVRDAFAHLKTIGFTHNLTTLFAKAGLAEDALDEACIQLAQSADAGKFVTRASQGKFWGREPYVRPPPDTKLTTGKGK